MRVGAGFGAGAFTTGSCGTVGVVSAVVGSGVAGVEPSSARPGRGFASAIASVTRTHSMARRRRVSTMGEALRTGAAAHRTATSRWEAPFDHRPAAPSVPLPGGSPPPLLTSPDPKLAAGGLTRPSNGHLGSENGDDRADTGR